MARAERAASLMAAANALRTDAIALPGAMRWVRRRVRLAHHVLMLVIGLLPGRLARCIAGGCAGAQTAWGRKRRCGRFAPSLPRSSRRCPRRWGFRPTDSARRIAIDAANTRWGLIRQRVLASVPVSLSKLYFVPRPAVRAVDRFAFPAVSPSEQRLPAGRSAWGITGPPLIPLQSSWTSGTRTV